MIFIYLRGQLLSSLKTGPWAPRVPGPPGTGKVATIRGFLSMSLKGAVGPKESWWIAALFYSRGSGARGPLLVRLPGEGVGEVTHVSEPHTWEPQA